MAVSDQPQENFFEAVAERPAFAPEEYQRRVGNACAAMGQEGFDALILFDPQSLCYFTGYTSVNLWDPGAVVISREGEVRVTIWEFEVPRFEASAAIGEPVTYRSHRPVTDALERAVSDLRGGMIGSDVWVGSASPELWQAVQKLVAPAVIGDARRVLWATRLVKSQAEIEKLRASAALTDAGIAAAADACQVGATDNDVAAAGAAAMLAGGSGHFSIQPVVAVGPRAGVPHSETSGRAIAQGEGVFLEFGAVIDRYTAPIMRTVVAGEADAEMIALAELVTAAVAAASDCARPGATAAEVAVAAHEVIDDSPERVLFHGYVGYPVGISFPPSWLENLAFHIHAGNEEPLSANMVFHLPISLRQRATRGVGLSSTIVVTETGAEVLSATAPQLIIR